LDLVLAERSGLSLLSNIRLDGPSVATPVVAVSMTTSVPPSPSADSAHFKVTDLLAKPIQADQVSVAFGKVGLLDGTSRRILVVDDDPVACDLMQATLEAMHLEVVCVSGGRAALQALEALQPDAIILDLMMPGFDGFQVLDVLNQSGRWQRTPVFIWTSMLLTEQEHAALARSAKAILSKGRGELDALLDELRNWRPAGQPVRGDA
jgi:CheY-like chemotaxis protein